MPLQCNPVPPHATRTLEPARSTVPAKHRGPYSQAAKAIVNRADAPVVRNLRRGITADALAALRDAGVTALVDDLLKDRYAQSAEASNASLLKTWAHFHAEAFRRSPNDATCSEPMLPLTVRSLVIIGALFKAGGYRSYPNYVSIIKSAHIEEGHDWSHLLQHTSAWVTRSVLRGIGPARQSCSFAFDKLILLPRSAAPLTEKGPHNPIHMALLASIFLLREVEASTATVSAWTLSTDKKEVTWKLPASKSDHMALGVSRSWPCLCGLHTIPCPYHLALEHLAWLTGSEFSSDPESPLFPSVDGSMASKATVVVTFEQIGLLCGQPLISDTGLRLFGGHTPRVTGSQLLAAIGIEINKIRLMARHSGDAINRYVQDAPLRSLRADLGLPSTGMTAQPASSGSSAAAAATLKRVALLEATVAKLDSSLREHAQALADPRSEVVLPQLFIQNAVTKTVHLTRPTNDSRGVCGWTFKGDTARARRKDAAKRTFWELPDIVGIPGHLLCERCLPTEHAAALAIGIVHDELSADES